MSQKAENLKQNLQNQIDALRKRDNRCGKATKDRYYKGACRAADFFAYNYILQRFANMQAKHFKAWVEHLKATKAPNTIHTEITALQFYIRLSGNKNKMPSNKELNLPKRDPTKYNRTWLPHEIDKVMKVADSMGRYDVKVALEVTKRFGLRIMEVCLLKVGNLKAAIEMVERFICSSCSSVSIGIYLT